MSEKTTPEYEVSKQKVSEFIHAPSWHNIVSTRNATEGLNMAARMLEGTIKEGDEILVSMMEHHSNLIPWMELAKRTGAKLRYIPIDQDGSIQMDAFKQMLNEKTKVLAMTHVSNVLGTINPIKEMIREAKARGAYSVIDGAQAAGSIAIDVSDLQADFYAFTGHKMLGPPGIGILYISDTIMHEFAPLYFGGDMVSHVDLQGITYNEHPWKFEAGTSNYEGGIALGYAIDYLQAIGIDAIHERKLQLRDLLTQQLQQLDGVRIYGATDDKLAIISFTIDGIHPHDIASLLDEDNICIRAGTHCAEPLVNTFGQSALARVNLGLYNNEEDIERFIISLKRIKNLFAHG